MHQDPEHEDYDDDEYNHYPEYNEYGYPYSSKKFDVDWAAWEQWLSKAIQEIVEEDKNVWMFGHNVNQKSKKSFSTQDKKTLNDKYFMYLGSNVHNQEIWKSKYFIVSYVDREYKNHILSHAKHFVSQPHYYKSMFDILN